jgi:Uncharacterized protein conserved in bacteria (DUF2330)
VRNRSVLALISVAMVVLAAAPAWACGGLLNPRGNINLVKTTTFAGYRAGVEHYVTSFEYAGGGGKFGSIVPLPGIPSEVVKGGDWTLQRLVEEVTPARRTAVFALAGESAAGSDAEVLMEKSIDALDITILKGGGDAVGAWAETNGFDLPPDAPEVLDFYAERSPIFMAARFDAKRARARGQQLGDGTPVHLVIPTPNPWVPLRILGLGRRAEEPIEADLFLLTESAPAMLPRPGTPVAAPGIELVRSESASQALLRDLRSDRAMGWLPAQGMHLSYLSINTSAGRLTHDLALDVSGAGVPSPLAAGLVPPAEPPADPPDASPLAWAIALLVGAGILVGTSRLAG